VSTWKATGDMAASVSIERKGGVLWVTVSCTNAEGKRASATAERAARTWVRDNRSEGFRRAFRRSSSQAFREGAFYYRAAFALG
jgi:hypothetical protein